MLKFFKQLFCRHNYLPVPDPELEKMIQESETELSNGTIDMYAYSQLHKCTKCLKETVLGSGFIS